jgi:hypothetical protein
VVAIGIVLSDESARMRVGGMLTWVELVLVYFDVRRTHVRPKFIGDSEKSDAQIETVGCQKERKDQAGPAKHGDHPEHIDVRSGC